MQSIIDVTSIGNVELNTLKGHIYDPTLRALIISRGDKIVFQRLISEVPVEYYDWNSQRVAFPAGGWVEVVPHWASPEQLVGPYNLIIIQGPYPDPYVNDLYTRLKGLPGDNIQPQLYYDGQPKIGEINGPIQEG